MAQELKAAGNAALADGKHEEALAKYTEGIEACGKREDALRSVLHANRSQAYLNLNKDEEAIADADAALKLDNTYIKAYFRKATAQMRLKRLDKSLETLRTALKKATGGGGKKKAAAGAGREIKRLRQLRNQVQALLNAERAKSPSVAESLLGRTKTRRGKGRGGGGIAETDVRELYSKVEVFRRDHRTCQQKIQNNHRELQMNGKALGDILEKVKNPDDQGIYKAIGKMYMLKPVNELKAELEKRNKELEEEKKALEKRERLTRRRRENGEKELGELVAQVQRFQQQQQRSQAQTTK